MEFVFTVINLIIIIDIFVGEKILNLTFKACHIYFWFPWNMRYQFRIITSTKIILMVLANILV